MSPTEGARGGSIGARGVDLLEGSPYRSLGMIGEGGMGEVFEAEHRTLGHRVVVKVLRDSYTARFEMRDRMRVEGQALARIRHPHLVMVTDFGETSAGRPFIVMERLEGRSLHDEIVARSALPPAEAAEIARQVLLGLHAAHEAGLVHRDVKPDNVFLCAAEGGRPLVKVLDFGLAKIAQAGRDPRTPMPLAAPTADGVMLGTPRYFSPEQSRGERDLDARSDLYSVGLVLYAMVVGHGPFDDVQEVRDLFRAHAVEAPKPPSQAAAQPIPKALELIVLKALAKPRDERYLDAIAFADDLGQFLSGLGEEGRRMSGVLPPVSRASAARALAEAPTFPAFPAMPAGPGDAASAGRPAASKGGTDPIVPAAGGAAASGGPVAGRGARKLPDNTVVLEGLVERVLANPPEHLREKLSPSGNIDRRVIDAAPAGRPSAPPPVSAGAPAVGRGSIPETVPMFEIGAPSRQAASGPGGPAPGRSSVPDTAPEIEIAVGARSAAGAASLAAPSGAPGAQPGHTAPLPTLQRPPVRAGWKVPALIVIVVVTLATIAVLFMRVLA